MIYISNMDKKKRKNIDLPESVIKLITKKAIDNGTVFKLYVENLLIKHSKIK